MHYYLLFSSVAFGESILAFERYLPPAAPPPLHFLSVGIGIGTFLAGNGRSTEALMILELDAREVIFPQERESEWPSQFTRLPSFSDPVMPTEITPPAILSWGARTLLNRTLPNQSLLYRNLLNRT